MNFLPWRRRPDPETQVRQAVDAALERHAESTAAATATAVQAAVEKTHEQYTEVLRALFNGPFNQPWEQPSAGNAPHPLYAYDRPYRYTVPQAPTRRPEALVTVETLRTLADTYDVLRACIQHLKREVFAVPLKIVAPDDSDVSAADKQRLKEATLWLEEVAGGDRESRQVFEGKVLEDLMVIGAGCTFFQRNRGGGLREALAIDAATIRPRVDAYGWPGPGEVAYEQWVQGLPAGDGFTREELWWEGLPIYARSWTPYPASPVEYLVHVIHSALRADDWNRSWLTDGSTPGTIIAAPETWTPDQIRDFATWFNSLRAGDSKVRQQVAFVPKGSDRMMEQSRKDQDFQQFELWLLRRCCAILGVQPASIGFVGEQYKTTQDESMHATTQFGAAQLLEYRVLLYNRMLRMGGYEDLAVQNVTDAEEAAASVTERNERAIYSGQMTPNEARKEAGRDNLPGGDTLFIKSDLVPVQRAANPPEPAAPSGSPAPGSSEPGKPQSGGEEGQPPAERGEALRLWMRKSLNRLKDGKAARCEFEHPALAAAEIADLLAGLERCETQAQVRALFERMDQ